MINELLVLERIVIEAMKNKATTVFEISEQTSLDSRVVMNLLKELVVRNIVRVSKNKFSYELIRKNTPHEIALKEEAKGLFVASVNEYFNQENKQRNVFEDKSSLIIEKVWMTPNQELAFNSMMHKLKEFLSEVKSANLFSNEKVCEKKVIYLGQATYKNIIDTCLA